MWKDSASASLLEQQSLSAAAHCLHKTRLLQLGYLSHFGAGASGAPFAGAVGGTMRTGWGQLRVAEFLAHSGAAVGSCVAVLSAGAVTGRSTPELRQRVGVV